MYSSGQDFSQRPPLYQFGQGASIPPISRNMPFMASHETNSMETSPGEISARSQQQWLPPWFPGANFTAPNPFFGGFYSQNTMQMQFNQLEQTVKKIEEKISAQIPSRATSCDQNETPFPSNDNNRESRKKSSKKSHEISDNEYSDVSSEEHNFSSDSEEEGEIRSGNSSSIFKDLATELSKEDVTKVQSSSSNMDRLDKLSLEFEQKEFYGPKVNDKLANTVNMGLKSTFSASALKEITGKYATPENCEWVRVPLINAEIWNSESLQETYKSNDKLFYKNQMLITKAMIPIIHIMNNCIEKKSQNDTFDLACDAFQLLAYAHRDASNLRRHMLKPSISKEYRKLCNPATPITEFVW